jgi:hypothetical protein
VRDWKEGGENSHKVQCKRLIEIKAKYGEFQEGYRGADGQVWSLVKGGRLGESRVQQHEGLD